MEPKYKQGDKTDKGTISAVRTTKWAHDGTTTNSYLVDSTQWAIHYKMPYADPKWYDEAELHALPQITESKFNVGDSVEYGASPYIVQKKTWYKNYGRWYYSLNHSIGVWELELKKTAPKCIFDKGDIVMRQNTYALYTVVRSEWRDWFNGGAKCGKFAVLLDTGNWYWEDNLSRFTPAAARFSVGERIDVGDAGWRTVQGFEFDAKKKEWKYTLSGGSQYYEGRLKKYVSPRPAPVFNGFGHAYGSKPCEHFRETEFVTMAQQRTMIKNRFCPDCGKNIR